MHNSLAPAVDRILRAAVDRDPPDGDIDVDARSLPDALAAAGADGRTPVIAEVKPTSPTTEGRDDRDPVALAEAMVAGGAAAISVLTEPTQFGGSPDMLRRVRSAVDVPVLRKDFVLTEAELDRVAADAVLLIARFLEDADAAPAADTDSLDTLVAAARERGLTPLVEVHSRDEVRTAVEAGADIIGVNNRDLARLKVDLGTVERVAPAVPNEATLVAESGITTPADARRMRDAGADGLLIGSAIVDGDVESNVTRFVGAEGNA